MDSLRWLGLKVVVDSPSVKSWEEGIPDGSNWKAMTKNTRDQHLGERKFCGDEGKVL